MILTDDYFLHWLKLHSRAFNTSLYANSHVEFNGVTDM